MPTFAVMGSTGNTGTCLVRNLLEHSPHNHVNAYCRNKAKLIDLVPEAVDNKRVTVFEGSFSDTDLIDSLLQDTKAVFLAVTSNDNIPGIRLNTETALTVIRSIYRLRDASGPGFRCPKVILLSASAPDDHLSRNMSKLFRPIILRAASAVYLDICRAEDILRSHDHCIQSVYVKPAGLSMDVARGYELTLDDQESFLSYNDLADAMIEVAADDDEGRWVGKSVGIVNKVRGQGAKFPTGTPKLIAAGFIRHMAPWLHPYLPSSG
ncbi:putative NAD-dependent epimerase/dehydratase [Coniochaeta sp. PMI_546]|nr:putative NAD-dependent epimerase/dehydratase [Coniochaeta sp. PMI_546]